MSSTSDVHVTIWGHLSRPKEGQETSIFDSGNKVSGKFYVLIYDHLNDPHEPVTSQSLSHTNKSFTHSHKSEAMYTEN